MSSFDTCPSPTRMPQPAPAIIITCAIQALMAVHVPRWLSGTVSGTMEPSRGPQSHSCAVLYIPSVISYRKYTGAVRDDDCAAPG